MKRWLALFALILCCLIGPALGEEAMESSERDISVSSIRAVVPVQGAQVDIRASVVDGETWLLLPAFADQAKMQLFDGDQPVTDADVQIMQSENLRALFLLSDDPVSQGREYIDNCERHEHFTTASMALVDADGHVDHAGKIRKLRGRGNGTWGGSKKPYQFKLDEPMDLLDTGLASEMERTWVLLAESSTQTMLHNRITLDMGLELGLSETSHSEHVDLYYDGEYRGTYLLAEKVEIGEGRVDEMDYEKLIGQWNDKVGQTDLSVLPVKGGVNQFNQPYTYLDGVIESASPDAGAYLVEIESTYTLSEKCWFTMHDGQILSLKNPESASGKMVEYISNRLQEARNTLLSGGVNSETIRTIHDDFDVDAFARTMLVQELSYNYDGYRYSSSFFVLPAGSTQFRPGPLWDFDIGYRYLSNGLAANGVGFKETSGWMYDFYQCPDFVESARQIYENELYPMVRDILLGDQQGRYLQSLDAYVAQIEASRQMNAVLWPRSTLNRYVYALDHEGEVALLRRFLTERSEWLHGVFGEEPDDNRIDLWVSATYGHTGETLLVQQKPWNRLKVEDVWFEQMTEATEEEYAWWQLWIWLENDGGEAPVVTVNGVELPVEMDEDGTWCVGGAFADPSYRPVDYYGEDIGMIYNYDVYVENYPEVAEECGYDPQAVMDAFYDEGIYENHMGNAFFRPSDVLAAFPEMEYMLGEDWWLYYGEFLSYGYESDKWLMHMGKCYWPEVISMY